MELTGYWSLLFQVPVGLIGLSAMVFIHELGHFAVAKWTGVKVHTFSIGFGKKLVKWRRGDTEYCISAIPFGGYVAMSGESAEDVGYGNSDEFRVKPIPVRMAIALAGPLANVIFAVAILFGLYLTGVQEPMTTTIVGEVEENSPAAKAGVRSGDELLKLGERPVAGWEVFMQDVAMGGANPVPLTLRRGGRDTTVTLVPEMNTKFGIAISGIGPSEIEVNSVMAGRPAAAAGIKAGDRLLTVDGVKVPSATTLIEMVNGSQGRPLNIELSRAGQKYSIQVSPILDKDSKRFIIGIIPMAAVPTQLVHRGPVDAFKKSVSKNIEHGTLVFRTLQGIFSGNIKAKALSGPIGIVQMIAGSMRQGMQKLLEFMALLNTNLAVLNLLPLAITDGGVVLFLLLEAIRRRPLALSTQNIINRVGFSFFLMLFLFVTFQDIIRIPWFLN